MAAKSFTCERCGSTFNAGSWQCPDGTRHTVPTKTYYVATEGLQGFYGPVTGDQPQNTVRKSFNFNHGMNMTSDPELQEHLDKYPGCISRDAWDAAHISDKDRREAMEKSNKRLESVNNDLLAQIQQLKEQAASNAQPVLAAAGKGK